MRYIQNLAVGAKPGSTIVREPKNKAYLLFVTIAESELLDEQPLLHSLDVSSNTRLYAGRLLWSRPYASWDTVTSKIERGTTLPWLEKTEICLDGYLFDVELRSAP